MDFSNKANVERLLIACKKGDRKSQHLLYQNFYGKMMAVCMRYADCREEAQDIFHEGFMKVFSKLDSFKNEGSLEGWIRRIVVNNAIDFVRRKKEMIFTYQEEAHLVNISDSKDDDETVDEEFFEIKAEVIMACIQKLTPAYKAVFNMYVIENYSHKEIAETLGISVGASKSNLAKAKLKLKEMFKQHIGHETEEYFRV